MHKFLILTLLLGACAQVPETTGLTTKGEQQMARVIFDERFPDQNLTSRGWSANAPGYYYEHDSQLGHQVLYARWTNKKTGMPDNGASTFFKRVNPADWNKTVTIHTAVKFHNWIWNGSGGNSHTMLRASVNGVLGNASGEIMLESLRNGYGARTYPYNDRDADRAFAVSFDMGAIGGDRYFANDHMEHYLEDDVWYEVALFLDTDNGGDDGRVAIWYREHGTTEWTEIFDYDGYTVLDVATSNPFVGVGPYFHHNYNNNEVRSYLGFVTVYEGDAMADGTLSGGGSTPAPGPDPEPEPDHPPVVSDITANPARTSAVISWKTDTPSNSVVDYGPTESRGTVIKDQTLKTEHAIGLIDLSEDTQYFYRLSSKDAEGRITLIEENRTFTTGEVVEPPTEPPVLMPLGLNDMDDVTIDSPQTGDLLRYDGTKWVNVTIDLDAIVEHKVIEVLNRAKIVVS